MALFKRNKVRNPGKGIRKYLQFSSSIYGQVMLIITAMSLLLFISFGLIFRSVYEQYMNTVLRESGSNIGSLVEGALYHSMMNNDKRSLQNTLDIINTMPNIEDVNMYDSEDNLAYSSFIPGADQKGHINPHCKNCHDDFGSMFPRKEKAFTIIDVDSQCEMIENQSSQRHLIIRSPILNERACYTADCHFHSEEEEVLGSLLIKMPLTELDAAVYNSSMDFYVFALLTTVLLVMGLIVFTRKKIKDPLNALIKVSQSVSSGDLTKRVKVKDAQVEDMRMVSQAFNTMLDNLQAATEELKNWSQQLEYKVQRKSEELGAVQNEIIHVERLASLGKLSSSVAHEINNPLSGILVYTKLIYKQLNNQEFTDPKRESMLKHLKMIESETKRCGDIVKSLLDFSRKEQEDFEPRNLHEVLEETYDLMAHPVKIANILFIKDFSAKQDLVYCSPNQIKQACVALIVNAMEATRDKGEIIFRTSNPSGESIMVEIADNGIGIAEENLPHIFEPFFSTKQGTSGIGMGLSIVHGIIQNHQGKIQVRSEQGNGTTVSFTLPIVVK